MYNLDLPSCTDSKSHIRRQAAAVLFGMSLSQTDIRIHRLSEVLKRAPGEGSYLPERDPSASEDALKKCSGLFFVTDGTGRRIQRPKDPEKQKIFYSGKKKCHTVKNNIIADAPPEKLYASAEHMRGKSTTKTYRMRKIRPSPEAAVFSKIQDSRDMNLKTRPAAI